MSQIDTNRFKPGQHVEFDGRSALVITRGVVGATGDTVYGIEFELGGYKLARESELNETAIAETFVYGEPADVLQIRDGVASVQRRGEYRVFQVPVSHLRTERES